MSFGIERKKSDYTPIYDLGVGKSASVKQAKSAARRSPSLVQGRKEDKTNYINNI